MGVRSIKANILKFNIKELTNYAMIYWLVSWANQRQEEYKEHRYLQIERSIKDIKSAVIKRQYKNINILVNINNIDLIII